MDKAPAKTDSSKQNKKVFSGTKLGSVLKGRQLKTLRLQNMKNQHLLRRRFDERTLAVDTENHTSKEWEISAENCYSEWTEKSCLWEASWLIPAYMNQWKNTGDFFPFNKWSNPRFIEQKHCFRTICTLYLQSATFFFKFDTRYAFEN